jgi:hypothetical protein
MGDVIQVTARGFVVLRTVTDTGRPATKRVPGALVQRFSEEVPEAPANA